MLLPPLKSLALPTLLTSSIFCLSSSSWLTMWIFLEINTFRIIPLLILPTTPPKVEARVKYFIVQSITSALILIAARVRMLETSILSTSIFLVAVVTKLGAAPSHKWILLVTKHLNKLNFTLILTWQKLIPLGLIINSSPKGPLIIMVIITNIFIGVLGAIRQTLLRPLLVFSSIAHIAWILRALIFSNTIFIVYVTTYIIIFGALIGTSPPSLPPLRWAPTHRITIPLTHSPPMALTFLSLGGVPPLLGFSIKLIVLWASPQTPLLILCLLRGSAIALLYYIMLTLRTTLPPKTTYLTPRLKIRGYFMIHLTTPIILIITL